MKLADHFVGKLRAGQADTKALAQSDLSRVSHDGWTYFYDIAADVSLEDFKIAAEVAFEMDASFAEIWASEGFYRVGFD